MSTINELPRINKWLRTVLAADSTLSTAVGGRFFEGHVPEGKSLPACVFSFTPDDDHRLTGPDRLWARGRALVKIVGETNSDGTLQTAADRIDAVLHAARGGTSDVAIDYCVRRRPFRMKDTSVANKVYLHLGGEYDLAARYTG